MNKKKSENSHQTLTFILDFKLAPKSQVWMASQNKLFVFISRSVLCQTMFFGGGGHLWFQIGTKSQVWMVSQKKLFACISRSVLCQTMFFGGGGHLGFQIGTKIVSLVEVSIMHDLV
jgi:hypothetical protein